MTDDAADFRPDHIEVEPMDDETGLNIMVRDEVALTITWKQAQDLNTLLCVELDLWLHRQGKWSIQIDKAGPVDLGDGTADQFADRVIDGSDLNDETADEVRPALTAWFYRWSTTPNDHRAEPGRE